MRFSGGQIRLQSSFGKRFCPAKQSIRAFVRLPRFHTCLCQKQELMENLTGFYLAREIQQRYVISKYHDERSLAAVMKAYLPVHLWRREEAEDVSTLQNLDHFVESLARYARSSRTTPLAQRVQKKNLERTAPKTSYRLTSEMIEMY